MFRFAGVVFAVAALVGPAVRYATWPPSSFEKRTSVGAEDFVYDLVFYLWPTQPLAVLAPTDGRLAALLLTVGGNLVLFVLVGLVVGAVASRRGGVVLVYATLCGFLLWFALWGAGYRLEHLDVSPLVLALALYAVPFWLVAAAAARQGR